MMYRLNKIAFNNPFVWAIVSYKDIYYLMNNFYDINWNTFDVEKSTIWEDTYLVNVDNNLKIHYLHYKYNPKALKPQKVLYSNSIDDEWNGNVIYNKIWDYVEEKYMDRVKRMKELKEPPVFLIHEESLGNKSSDVTLSDLAEADSKFRRYIITTNSTISRNDDICRISVVNQRLYPIPQMMAEHEKICSFLLSR